MNTATIAPVLEIKRVLDALPERAFAAWMERDKWQAWIGPEGCRSDVTEFEPRVGGRYRVLMHLSEGQDLLVTGIYRAIEAPRRIAMSWKWEHGTHDSLVTVSFRELDGKTELTLRHEGLETQDNCDAHGKGWNSALNDLEKHLAGRL